MKLRPFWGGSWGVAAFILNLTARNIECSTSCCSQSPCPCLGVLASYILWMGGWIDSRPGLMFWGKTLAPAMIQTPDRPAHIVVIYWLQYSCPSRKWRCRNLWVIDNCKFHCYWHLSDIKLNFKQMKFSLMRALETCWGLEV